MDIIVFLHTCSPGFVEDIKQWIENSLGLFSKRILQHEMTDIAHEIKHTHKNIIFLKIKMINLSLINFFS